MNLGELKKQIKRLEKFEAITDDTEIRLGEYGGTSSISTGIYKENETIIIY